LRDAVLCEDHKPVWILGGLTDRAEIIDRARRMVVTLVPDNGDAE
jgi:hypothetical protein